MGRAGYFLWLNLKTFSATRTESSPLIANEPDADRQKDESNQPSSYDKANASHQRTLALYYSPANTVEACIDRGVIGNDGAPFGAPDHIRLNLACHPALIEEALLRLCFATESI